MQHHIFRLLIIIVMMLYTTNVKAQLERDIMVGLQGDLIKGDYDGFFQKAQVGGEVNYFLSSKFSATGGIEVWTEDQLNLVVGARWYPIDDAFIRLRGLLGSNDVSIGGGWAYPLRDNFKFEAMGEFYFSGDFAIRAGISYMIRRLK